MPDFMISVPGVGDRLPCPQGATRKWTLGWGTTFHVLRVPPENGPWGCLGVPWGVAFPVEGSEVPRLPTKTSLQELIRLSRVSRGNDVRARCSEPPFPTRGGQDDGT